VSPEQLYSPRPSHEPMSTKLKLVLALLALVVVYKVVVQE
jgi:hypothetical protein